MSPQWLRELTARAPLPDPAGADEHGLVAWGGDLSLVRLLSAYASGIFPWYDAPPILWFSPDPRMVLRPAELRINRSLARTLRRGRYELRCDSAFGEVIRACAQAPRPGQDGTWINEDMIAAYEALHAEGFAHSVETWWEGELVGGIYGVSLGAAFFGESMFATQSDASKVALVGLIRRIESWGFDFLDCQVHTEHTERLGAREWPRSEFLAALERALESPTRRGRWSLAPERYEQGAGELPSHE